MKGPVKIALLVISISMITGFAFFNFSGSHNASLPVNPSSIKFEPEQVPQVRPGDIILLSENDMLDRVIKLLTNSPYNHVVGVINSSQVVDILPWTTVKYGDLQNFVNRADIFTCDQLTDADRAKIVNFITSKIGASYNYYLLLWEASRYLFNWVWPYKGNGAYTCSTLWAEAYREAGIDLCPGIKFPSPGDLANSKYLRKT